MSDAPRDPFVGHGDEADLRTRGRLLRAAIEEASQRGSLPAAAGALSLEDVQAIVVEVDRALADLEQRMRDVERRLGGEGT
jgi:hypothetical protein